MTNNDKNQTEASHKNAEDVIELRLPGRCGLSGVELVLKGQKDELVELLRPIGEGTLRQAMQDIKFEMKLMDIAIRAEQKGTLYSFSGVETDKFHQFSANGLKERYNAYEKTYKFLEDVDWNYFQ